MRKYGKKLKSFFIMLLIIAIALQQFSLSTGASEVNQNGGEAPVITDMPENETVPTPIAEPESGGTHTQEVGEDVTPEPDLEEAAVPTTEP